MCAGGCEWTDERREEEEGKRASGRRVGGWLGSGLELHRRRRRGWVRPEALVTRSRLQAAAARHRMDEVIMNLLQAEPEVEDEQHEQHGRQHEQ